MIKATEKAVVSSGRGDFKDDEVIIEEPLAIRISGETLAITMRTPGDDLELVYGFLHSEGVIEFPSDVSAFKSCGTLSSSEHLKDTSVDVTLAPGVRAPIDPDTGMLAKRGTLVSSACGVCGRTAINDLLARAKSLPSDDVKVERRVVVEMMRDMKDRQPLFRATGACHAASIVATNGDHVVTYEDVGRHNAVDKAIGHCVRSAALPLKSHVLAVSGRCSFEIVQKAVMARIPIVAAVSAATSLAVELARRANVTLIGFVRDGTMTVYEDQAARLR